MFGCEDWKEEGTEDAAVVLLTSRLDKCVKLWQLEQLKW
jgi:hypothetical protein